MDLNLNAKLINNVAKSYHPAPFNDTQQVMRVQDTMNDIINSKPNPISYISEKQLPNRIRTNGISNYTPTVELVEDDTLTMDDKREQFRIKELVGRKIEISKDLIVVVIVIIVLFSLYTIFSINTSQKKIEFMVNYIYQKSLSNY